MTRERRLILIGGVVLLLIGAIYRFYPDIRDSFSYENEIALKKKNLIKYRRMMQERNALKVNLSILEEQLKSSETGLLSGETSAIAAVEIQDMLNEISGSNEIEIRSMQVMKPKQQGDEPYLAVPIQVSMETDARGLKNVLYGIETSPKALQIKDLKIRAIRRGEPDRIQATFTIEGYMIKK